MYIPKYLSGQIEEKRKAIIDSPNGRLKQYKQTQSNRETEAKIHTARGEVPISELHYRPRLKRSQKYKQVLEGVDNAWRFGTIAYPTEGLTEHFLTRLAWELDPEFFGGSHKSNTDHAYFRRPNSLVNTVVAAWNHVPPNPNRIQDDLHQYLFDNHLLDNMTIPEQAIYSNLHITRIQPFPDCNKRTGKLVQNLHLNSGLYPPATVLEGEVELYNQLLGEAIHGFKERQGKGRASKEEVDFFHFMGTKMNINLDAILDSEQKSLVSAK